MISSTLEWKELYKTLPSNSVCFVVLLNFQTVFSSVALLSTTHASVCTFERSGESERIVEGVAEGIVWIVFKFCSCRDWQKYPLWNLAFLNWKLGVLEIVDLDDCVKLAGVFTSLFVTALCSSCLIFFASSESTWGHVDIPAQ